VGKSSDKVELQNVSGGSLVVGCDRFTASSPMLLYSELERCDVKEVNLAPGSLPWDLVPNRQTLNLISKSPKSNQISNRSDPNRILNGQIESREVILSRFKSNRD